MQQEVTDGTKALLEPKKEVIERDHDYVTTNLSSVALKNENSPHIQIKKEIDSNCQEDEKEIVMESPNLTEDLNCVNQQLEKDKENVNNDQLDLPGQELINKDPEMVINVDLQAVINNESVPTVEIANSNPVQAEIGIELRINEENDQLNQIEEINEENGKSNENEGLNCDLQQDQAPIEINTSTEEQPEGEKEIIHNSEVVEADLDGVNGSDLECIENNSEFVIIDIADYDQELPTPDDYISFIDEDIESTTDEVATKETTNKPGPNKPKTNQPQAKTDPKKHRFLKNLERQIVRQKLNPSNLPPHIWNSLKKFSGAQRKTFLKNIKEKLTVNKPGPSNQSQSGDVMKQDVINDLTHSLSKWLSDQWVRMEGNTNSANNQKVKNIRDIGKPFTEVQKRKFLQYIEKSIDHNTMDVNNLPPRIWNSMQRLRTGERMKFMKAMKEKQARRLNSGSKSGPSGNSMPHSNSPLKRDINNKPSHSEIRSATWRNNQSTESRNKSYSFDRDFHNQRLNEAAVSPTSQVSPNVFSRYFQDSYSQPLSPEKNMIRNPYHTQSSYQTPNRDDNSFRRSSYEREREGVNRPSYSDNSNYQAQSYNNSRYSSAGPSRTFENSPHGSRIQPNPYNNPSKRKLPDSSRAQPKKAKIVSPPKPKNNSISAVITDDNNPRGTMIAEQASLLSGELVRLLDEVSLSNRGYIPRFNNSGLSHAGVFKINCADQKSFDWLSTMVSQLPELWKGAKLHVSNFVPVSAKRVRANLFIPGGTNDDSVTTLSRLERQNPGLNTGSWKVYRQTKNARGHVLFLEINENSEQVLKKMNYKAFLGLSSVNIQIDKFKKGKQR